MSLVVFGSINRDVVMRVAHLPRPGETLCAQSHDLLPGGKGANQATAAALQGVPTIMLGAVGEDAHGAAMRAALAAAGVDTAAIAHVPGPTGLAYVFVAEDGENQIVIVPGANGALRAPASLPPGTTMALAQAEVAPDEVAAFLALARKAGATTLYNAAPATDEARAALALADIVVVNETELAFFLGEPEPPHGEAAVARAATRLACHPQPGHARQWVIVTLGGAGVLAHGPEGTIRLPAPRVPVVDTTGAGDTFCGVLAARLAQGAMMPEALAFAVAAAALAVQRAGAAAAMPTRGDVEAALACSTR
ncbi:ribokinase [Novosphingobium pituita]|uniref:Ribokinase n=1 Tax=Novosphingobium pituita TaxID=3056842 RepID=A0ABQ6P8X7_9SPHN|nr:ribokinase [Novosphingobium sp. IK01]GMM60581.1 ribokinase [Novosphingobium sp. IK01]